MVKILSIPARYEINKKFAVKTFLTSALRPGEKKRFRENVQEVKLLYQIAGEDIPSFLNDEYDCQVILFLNVRLSELKNAKFVGNILQKLIKPLCVLRFRDHTNQEVYCFAHKRLNLQERTQVVIEDLVFSSPFSTEFRDEKNILIEKNAAFESIQNRGNKLDFYLEMMIKIYLISNLYLWSGIKALLVSRAWYNRDNMLELYGQLKRVAQLKKEQKSARTVAQNARINSELKWLYARCAKYLENT